MIFVCFLIFYCFYRNSSQLGTCMADTTQNRCTNLCNCWCGEAFTISDIFRTASFCALQFLGSMTNRISFILTLRESKQRGCYRFCNAWRTNFIQSRLNITLNVMHQMTRICKMRFTCIKSLLGRHLLVPTIRVWFVDDFRGPRQHWGQSEP